MLLLWEQFKGMARKSGRYTRSRSEITTPTSNSAQCRWLLPAALLLGRCEPDLLLLYIHHHLRHRRPP